MVPVIVGIGVLIGVCHLVLLRLDPRSTATRSRMTSAMWRMEEHGW